MPRPQLPILVFQGAITRSRSGDSAGFEFSRWPENGIDHFQIQPRRLAQSEDENPCNYVAYFRYEQNDAEADMLLSLVCGGKGGAVGSAAELQVTSNYPEIRMSHGKFKFSQLGKGIQLKGYLPRDYRAVIALKFWIEDANLTPDDWIRLEVSRLNQGAAIIAGKATLYPSEKRV